MGWFMNWLMNWLMNWRSGEFTLLFFGRGDVRGSTASVDLELLRKVANSSAGTGRSLNSVLFGKVTTIDELSISHLSALANLLVNELSVLQVDQRSGKSRHSA